MEEMNRHVQEMSTEMYRKAAEEQAKQQQSKKEKDESKKDENIVDADYEVKDDKKDEKK